MTALMCLLYCTGSRYEYGRIFFGVPKRKKLLSLDPLTPMKKIKIFLKGLCPCINIQNYVRQTSCTIFIFNVHIYVFQSLYSMNDHRIRVPAFVFSCVCVSFFYYPLLCHHSCPAAGSALISATARGRRAQHTFCSASPQVKKKRKEENKCHFPS